MAFAIIGLDVGRMNGAGLRERLQTAPATAPFEGYQQIATFVSGLGQGSPVESALYVACDDGTGTAAASRTITITFGSVSDGDTVTFGSTVFTARTAPTLATEFAIGANGTATATNLAALINASTATRGIISATSATTVVTVTSVLPGRIGNFYHIAVSDAVAFTLNSTGATLLGGSANTSAGAPTTYSRGV